MCLDLLQAQFAEQSVEGADRILSATQSALNPSSPEKAAAAAGEKPYVLEEFALDHFRPPPKRTLSRTLSRNSLRRKESGEIWAFSRV